MHSSLSAQAKVTRLQKRSRSSRGLLQLARLLLAATTLHLFTEAGPHDRAKVADSLRLLVSEWLAVPAPSIDAIAEHVLALIKRHVNAIDTSKREASSDWERPSR